VWEEEGKEGEGGREGGGRRKGRRGKEERRKGEKGNECYFPQKWRYFPSAWSERGEFVPIDYDPYQVNKVREGEFIHPTKGKLPTFLKQVRMMPRANDSTSSFLQFLPFQFSSFLVSFSSSSLLSFLLLFYLFHQPSLFSPLFSPLLIYTISPYQETLNSLHFFDEDSGVWLPMPLSWERHAPTVAPLITEIQVIYLPEGAGGEGEGRGGGERREGRG
jgi:hypothetical protein